ncbi:TPA: TonB-dependent siderophore receptor, partial [Escherichia coli]|nr:TonB-dependent siderophore receptor [Escherichia coli]
RQYVIDNEKLENFSVDTQLQSKFATGSVDHTLLTGVDFMRMRNDIDSWFGYAGSVAPSDIYNLDRSDFDFGAHPNPSGPYRVLLKQKQTGLYVQDQAQWDKVLVTLGGRYDWADQSSFNRDYGNKSERDDKEFTWRGGVNYLFDNGVTPYFSYSESFEPASQTDANGDLFAPSKGKQYEVGVKYVPEDRPIVVTGALYQLTKTNNLMADPNGSLFSVEGGEIRARGVELEAKAALSASVNVVGSYTYTDAEYTTDTTYKGNTPAQVPKHMASLWADYTFFDGPLSGLTLGTGGRYTGSSYGDPANSFKVGSYTVVDALVRYDLARVGMAGSNVALHVNNLFDREYVASCFNTYGCFWGAERQVVATATFRF